MGFTLSIDIKAARKAFLSRQQRALEQHEALRQNALQAVHSVAPSVIAKYQTVTAAYLFGSILRPGAFQADSDIDIALEGVSAEDYFALWRELEEALPDWLIDLRDLPLDQHFAKRVRNTGEKIYG